MNDTASLHSMESADTSRPLPMTFGRWKDACMRAATASEDLNDKIRAQAKQIFTFLSKQLEHMTPENVVMTTKSSHNEALAQLVQELGPAFSEDASYSSRICALYCICGAIEAGSEVGLSYKITNLLGNFFLGQCGPLEPEDDADEDTDEAVRDAAIMCLTALVRARIVHEETSDCEALHQAVKLHLDLARKGVERRCAAPEMDDEMQYDHGYDDFPASRGNDIRGGLSTLPRSRRALCFDLVRAAIDGLVSAADESLRGSNVASDLASFASFADNCLHGESDPRCLLQLLRMLHAMQTTMLPFFQTTSSTVKFPILNLFDAVAPYYPIHFTPPPNDVYGITRQGLHEALMAVLCFTGYDALEPGNDTMLNLSAGIFIERLLNVDSEEGNTPSSADDKLEALADLSTLLFPTADASLCDKLSEDTVRELSTVLFVAHSEGASGASAGGETGRKYKALADACRTLVSKLAYAFETSTRPALWNTFVRDTVQTRSQVLSTSPQSVQGRSSIAYLACLAASGGPRTMILCLHSCLPPLIDIIDTDKDEEKVAAAIYGIGAFFSSFQVAVERGNKDGVALHPHPLEPYSGPVSRSLLRLMGVGTDGDPFKTKDATSSLYIAAVHALESVLTITPLSLLEESDIDNICTLLDAMASLVESTDEIYANEIDIDSADVSVRKAASRTLGSTLGASFDSSQRPSQLRSVIDESDRIRTHLRESIYPKLLLSSETVISPKKESDPLRFDWMTLANACEMNRGRVMADLVNSLKGSLENKNIGDAYLKKEIQLAMRFCFVIQQGGGLAAAAFRSLSAPNTSPVDLIMSLCSMQATDEEKGKVRASPEKTGVTRVSALMLPPTSEDKQEVDVMVNRAYAILPYLTPAYEHALSGPNMKDFLSNVSQVIPPLSVWQHGQLCVMLPFLSTVLSKGSGVLRGDADEGNVFDSLHSMAPYLIDCALNSDFDARARSSAANCLYHIITKFQEPDTADCLSRVALRENVTPVIISAAANLKAMSDPVAEKAAIDLCEALDLAALLGTAAACRGRASSKIADDVARFLIQLSCDGKASVPFVNETRMVDISAPAEVKLHFASSSAFGTMLSTEDGGPFWRQRLMHLAARHLMEVSNGLDTTSLLSANALTSTEIGCLLISCFVIASSAVTSLGENALSAMADRIMLDFSRMYADGSNTNETLDNLGTLTFSVKEMVLAAVVKLMAVAPHTVAKYNSTLVPSLLHAYMDSYAENPMLILPCKMLALQGLFNATEALEQNKAMLLALKPVVVSVLSDASDNPSSSLRQAAMDTRNAWFTVT